MPKITSASARSLTAATPRAAARCPVRISRTMRSATSAVTSAEPTAVGITSTSSAPTSVELVGERAHRPEQLARPPSRPARACRCPARPTGRARRCRPKGTPGPRRRCRRRGRRPPRCPSARNVVHEERGDPALALPGELRLARPVAAQADLHVAGGVDARPARRAGASACRASAAGRRPRWRCRYARRSGRARRRRGGPRRRGCRARRSSDRRRARSGSRRRRCTSPTSRSIAACEAAGVGGDHRRHRRSRSTRSARTASMPAARWTPGRAAGGADRPRGEAGAGPVGDEIVGRRADDRDVGADEVRRILGVGLPGEAEQAGEVGLLAVARPARERIDHRRGTVAADRRRPLTFRACASSCGRSSTAS